MFFIYAFHCLLMVNVFCWKKKHFPPFFFLWGLVVARMAACTSPSQQRSLCACQLEEMERITGLILLKFLDVTFRISHRGTTAEMNHLAYCANICKCTTTAITVAPPSQKLRKSNALSCSRTCSHLERGRLFRAPCSEKILGVYWFVHSVSNPQ